jgi:thiol-disulfide isomerase/thioredoxin
LFFHASRCPACKAAESNIIANKDTIDSNLVILKVDYDTAIELKKQYAITSQTSYVLLNTDGTLNKKSVGMTSLEDIEKFVQ